MYVKNNYSPILLRRSLIIHYISHKMLCKVLIVKKKYVFAYQYFADGKGVS